MTTTAKRPVYLNLLQIKLPLPGMVSIGHRISGVLLVFAIPFAAHVLALSLEGPEGFAQAAALLAPWWVQAGLFLLGWGLLHHLFAGIRYLFLDMDRGVDLPTARRSAWAVAIGAPLATLFLVLGAWL